MCAAGLMKFASRWPCDRSWERSAAAWRLSPVAGAPCTCPFVAFLSFGGCYLFCFSWDKILFLYPRPSPNMSPILALNSDQSISPAGCPNHWCTGIKWWWHHHSGILLLFQSTFKWIVTPNLFEASLSLEVCLLGNSKVQSAWQHYPSQTTCHFDLAITSHPWPS